MNFVQWMKSVYRAVRYARSESYDARRFWDDRHRRYGSGFQAVADSEQDEHTRYKTQREQVAAFLGTIGVQLKSAHCVEFGCGNAFWGQTVLDAGAASYAGVDISPTAVEFCRRRLPQCRFDCADLGSTGFDLTPKRDLAFSIDVTQHVVEERSLRCFLSSMSRCTCAGGHIVVTSYLGCGDQYTDPEVALSVVGVPILRKARWVHTWDLPTIKDAFTDATLIAQAPFWDKTILAFRRH